ncbi:MAG: NAD-dependent succinate-semialdehyde dehydrogenase [Gammaproteobacteria bacterium]
MLLRSINPANGEQLSAHTPWTPAEVEEALAQVAAATPVWSNLKIQERTARLRRAAALLRDQKAGLARMITLEMGKLIQESEAEIEKCAWVCDYYAEHGESFLADEIIESDADVSLVCYQSLGTVLAIMPWNFPFWQVFRCAIPALTAGNTVVLKHASNVTECALGIEQLFAEAGFAPGVFRTLLISGSQTEPIIADGRIHAVSVTGSEATGRAVAAVAGRELKKTVLELGGSDPFVVLPDADIPRTAQAAVSARFVNGGQSCIAAKRFVLVDDIADGFLEHFMTAVASLRPGDPFDPATTLPPMARADLRQELHAQVEESLAQGAQLLTGGKPLPGPGNFYPPTVLDRVCPTTPAYEQELFGPVAAIIRARDEEDALRIANDCRYGLGASVWTRDRSRGQHFARRLACGVAFANGVVKSDPRLPFGGIKASGYGRELSLLGMREFVNAKTLWIK